MSRNQRPDQRPGGSDYRVQSQRPGPYAGNSRPGSLRRPDSTPDYYNRNYNRNSGYHDRRYYHPSGHSSYRHRYSPYSHYYNPYNRCFTPAWRGPVVYPSFYDYGYRSGFSLGFSWSSGSSWLSFSSSSPVYYNYHTPYYSSAYYGGSGYSSMYYGGWRSGWYGGFSYVYNPWPVYRTYYLYEPTPLVIQQPVIIQQEAVVQYERPLEKYTSEVQVQPVTYISQQNPGQIVIEERTTIRDADQPIEYPAAEPEYPADEPVAYNPEYAADDLYDEYFYAGEYMREEFTLIFSSYATSLNPETIWISYAGLDRWQY
ncbi:MAG: hypothetical protein PHO37_08420 [Kiritimatiellae bacterium]|nr:hypothetical protein [Kiritimatiellia bacterium]